MLIDPQAKTQGALALDALMVKYDTDKRSGANCYCYAYEALFGAVRESVESVLEIGVLGGASLRVWRDWFPNARIIGVDKIPAALQDYGPRIETAYCDQSDLASLEIIAAKYQNLDIIIDDGSHVYAHQTVSFETLFPCLAPGGWYVIEDVFLTTKWEGEAGKIFFHMNGVAETLNRYRAAERTPIAQMMLSVTHFDSVLAVQRRWR